MQVYIAFAICSAFFFFQYVLRVLPNIISQNLIAEFDISFKEFGSLGTIYSITYGLMQIPLGILLDRFTIRKIGICTISLCIIGGILFGFATHFWMLQLSRFVLALGSAGAFGMAAKVVSSNFEGTKRGIMIGAIMMIGALDPIVGTELINKALASFAWEDIIIKTSVLGGGVLLIAIVFLKDITHRSSTSVENNISRLGKLFSFHIFLYGLFAASMISFICVFSDVYGSQFLEVKFGIGGGQAAEFCTLSYFGFAAASLILPYISEKTGQPNLTITIVLIIKSFLCCIFLLQSSSDHLNVLLLMIGFFAGSDTICFSAALNEVNKNRAGLTIGIVNSLEITLNGVYQFIVGYLIDLHWNGGMKSDGTRLYSAEDFVAGLSFIPVILFICAGLSIYLMYHKKQEQQQKLHFGKALATT